MTLTVFFVVVAAAFVISIHNGLHRGTLMGSLCLAFKLKCVYLGHRETI